jgi:hypothetical protein
MERCSIVTYDKICSLIRRYDGSRQPPLTKDETEILLFALYNESEARDGIVAEARHSSNAQLPWQCRD